MSRFRFKTVQILNPLPGGAQYTTRKSALQFVRRGLAFFESGGGAIRFLNQSPRIAGSQHDGIGGKFWWRYGKTGKMSQIIGNVAFPAPRNTDRSI